MKISLEKGEFGWRVACGDLYEDQLGCDEALWTVAQLLLNQRPNYLRSPQQHAAWNAKYGPKPPLESWQKLLPIR